MREILVIGGTGAQGLPVIKEFARLPNVSLIEGKQDNQEDLHKAFKGVYGAWVNTDGFTIAYEIARHHGHADWDENYHWGHNDAKGRIADYILAQGQAGMKSSVLTTGPYMNMLWDGMFVPTQEPDRTSVWANPAKSGKISLIALEVVGHDSLWLFKNLPESAGMNLKISTDEFSFADIAAAFSEVTGEKGVHRYVPLEDAVTDESTMTWRQNFSAWWKYWGEGRAEHRDFTLLNRIPPESSSAAMQQQQAGPPV
ncbi:NAD(P)-binding protein [Aspergillus piperis CBS 112811]|uniref:NAD(P)-binding protein n=1 Tax=Aspergillus piperis CBS 112811 TaxID=1448313 RepID=A0A8G1VIY9_9EURO|nr:NAD(P)-binding protein [Aspergillus piperis CBS 112811]RAH52208.1 NAD(P)-binding protein [Aspergillus piperis CBS 112811]